MKKILAVDDDADILNLLKVYLKNKYDLITASNGKDALDLLKTSSSLPDLILLDMEMPVMSGSSFTKALKAEPSLKGIPVIYLTANVHYSDDVNHGFEFDFLNKPIDKEDLLSILDSFFRLQN